MRGGAPNATPGAMLVNVVGQMQARSRAGSWMLPEAKSEALVYVANSTDRVTVYSLKSQALVGTIDMSGGSSPDGMCVDAKGNVFVTVPTGNEILEYRHGGTKPIRTLSDPGTGPHDCAVDPTTGDLAVANGYDFMSGSVVVYYKAIGTRNRIYREGYVAFSYCVYDNSGNLFVDGNARGTFSYYIAFAELPSGGGKLINLALNGSYGGGSFDYAGGLQWDGKQLTMGQQEGHNIYQLALSGSQLNETGVTKLDEGELTQYWIHPRTIPHKQIIVGTGGISNPKTIMYWSYPAGGNAFATITDGVYYPNGVVISVPR